MKILSGLLASAALALHLPAAPGASQPSAAPPLRLAEVPRDLSEAAVQWADPAPGKRVPQVSMGWECSEVHHLLQLPRDWRPGRLYPVLVEYPGNLYDDGHGNVCSGLPASCTLGQGLSAGEGLIWVSLPFIEERAGQWGNAPRWWGDETQTRNYCMATVREVCARYGGDPKRLFIGGFSRGSIAANRIGLMDEEIASLWRGFICHSHYDGSRRWPQDGGAPAIAARLARLRCRAQWISHEIDPKATAFWERLDPRAGRFTKVALPFAEHSAAWVLCDLPQRQQLRHWFARLCAEP